MHQPVVSIIIPVFKAEEYLHRCLESFLAQTYSDFEVILVDDGSPDRSGDICDFYAERDSRFRVIHQRNRGVSAARQTGLNAAVGTYTIHADPDDWVEPTMLFDLVQKAEESDADMVICDFYENTDSNQKYISQKPSQLDHFSVLKLLLFQQLHGSCCNKLVRRDCYNRYKISFPPEIIRWEDLWVNCLTLVHPIKVVYLSKAFYHYDQVINSNSIVRVVSKKGVESQIVFCERMKQILDEKGFHTEELLFPCIAVTKLLMYVSGYYSGNEISSFFPSTNAKIGQQYKSFSLYKLPEYCLSLLLRKREILAGIMYHVGVKILVPIGSKIKKLFVK